LNIPPKSGVVAPVVIIAVSSTLYIAVASQYESRIGTHTVIWAVCGFKRTWRDRRDSGDSASGKSCLLGKSGRTGSVVPFALALATPRGFPADPLQFHQIDDFPRVS
jgi:hypothetical protein